MAGGLDAGAMAAAHAHLDRLTKPLGSLGRLEELCVWLAGVTGDPRPSFERRTILVAAADHGVVAQGVSAWPSEVTAQMVGNYLAGRAAISVLARLARAELVVLDVGVASEVPSSPAGASVARLVRRRVAAGTADFSRQPAMTGAEVETAIAAGAELMAELVSNGTSIVAVGEMGIGNTTSSSAIVAALTGSAVGDLTGYGAGLDESGRRRKIAVIEAALEMHRPQRGDPLDVLAKVGGLEIAALVGAMHAAAERRVPIVLDGFITAAAALVAVTMRPEIRHQLLAAHRSAERGHAVALEELRLRPLLELDLRLGEGTGAALALLVIDAAIALRDGMASFDEARVGSARHTAAHPDRQSNDDD